MRQENQIDMKQPNKTLTKGEMQVMNILWQLDKPSEIREIIELYDEPKPAYTTVATFLKILFNKKFVNFTRGQGKLHLYYALITKEAYTRRVMDDVKDSFFDGSVSSLINFFVRDKQISEAELQELLSMVRLQ